MKGSNLQISTLLRTQRAISSPSIKSSWTPNELKTPMSHINQIFNSVKDIYDKETITEGIKKLKTVNERLQFIDLLLKRRDEIDDMDELAQISKLGPLFERVKQKFMKKIKEKKSLQTKNRSSLFRKNSILTPVLVLPPTIVINSEKLEHDRLKKNSDRKRATVFNVVSGFNERKFFAKKEEEDFIMEASIPVFQRSDNRIPTFSKEKNENLVSKSPTIIKSSLTQRKRSLGAINFKPEQINHLQKDLFKYVMRNEQQKHFFELDTITPYLSKNIQSIDNEVLRLINVHKNSKNKDSNYLNSQLKFMNNNKNGNSLTSRYQTKFSENKQKAFFQGKINKNIKSYYFLILIKFCKYFQYFH